jgi:alpha-tubulin suppressor-like RCC1 family protein
VLNIGGGRGDQRLKALAMPTASDGWIVTGSGFAMGTRDGGQTWQRVLTSAGDTWKFDPPKTPIPLFSLSFADATHGWAVGGRGSVLRVSVLDQAEVALGSDPNSQDVEAGDSVVLTVDAHARSGPAVGTPTGMVEFSKAGVVLGTVALSGGVARLTSAPLPPGPQLFTARYLGDARFAATPPVALWLSPTRPVLGWGYNGVGPLGTGTTTNSPGPVAAAVPFPGLASAWYNQIIQAAGGGFHSLTLAENGILYASGWNHFGQLGLGDTVDRLTPLRVIDFASVRNAAGGAFHSLAVTTDGKVWAWGWNGYGELGTAAGSDPLRPAEVVGLDDVAVVAAGAVHSLALEGDGTVWAWGWNGVGQLGDGTTTSRSAPVRVPGLTGVVAIAAGSHHSLAVKADGSVWAWGWNVQGQLGDGTTVDRHVPVQIAGLTARSVAAGAYHSLAVRPDGSVAAWGWNGVGQLGDGTTVNRLRPVTAVGLTGATTVAAGSYHSLALDGTGTVRAWGWNYFGQLGDGSTVDRWRATPVPGTTGQGVLAAGSVHSLAM